MKYEHNFCSEFLIEMEDNLPDGYTFTIRGDGDLIFMCENIRRQDDMPSTIADGMEFLTEYLKNKI